MTAKITPGPVPAEVLAYLGRKRARPQWDYTETHADEHAAAFVISKMLEQSLVETMQAAVHRAIKEGQSYADFARDVTPHLQKAGWWGEDAEGNRLGSPSRLRLIIETNTRTARAAGQWQRIEKSKAVLPYLRWRLGASHQHRPDHVDFAEAPTILPVDHPFWNTAMPPCAFNCRCWVEQITKRQRADLPETEEPDLTPIPVEGRPGRTTIRGIDPSFAYNPGKNRLAGVLQAAKDAGVKVPEEIKLVAKPSE